MLLTSCSTVILLVVSSCKSLTCVDSLSLSASSEMEDILSWVRSVISLTVWRFSSMVCAASDVSVTPAGSIIAAATLSASADWIIWSSSSLEDSPVCNCVISLRILLKMAPFCDSQSSEPKSVEGTLLILDGASGTS